jgi:diguanylate cyclase (GGDEF)-like protein
VALAKDEVKFKEMMLKSKITRHSIFGIMMSLVIIVGATVIVSQMKYDQSSLTSLLWAQASSPVLWGLNLTPFLFAVLGQYLGRKIIFKTEALLINPTEKETAKTKATIDKVMRNILRDHLTGLPNRVLFKDYLEYAIRIAGRDNSKLSIFILNINRFKEINYTLGHFKGDLLLRAVAIRLLGVLRKSDTLARFGGDEFGILMPAIHKIDDLDIILKKIKKAFDPAFVLEGINLDVQASIGAVLYPDHGKDADTLLKRADVAMSLAKDNSGKFVLYDPEIDKYSSCRLSLMSELKNAIHDDELTLYYQPKIDIEKKRIIGAEALVRWTHKDRGIILPDEFIGIAERTGLINPLFQWVAKHALTKTSDWRKSGFDISASINLSPTNLLDPGLTDIIERLPDLYEVPPQKIIFEITETALMSDPNLSMSVLSHINQMGFKFSIDDFGTGYSSFAYLAKLPVSEIKIDKSFVMGMLKNETNYIIVHTTIEMAHNLGLEVVAEGVENEEILNELNLMGCDMAQGYFINKPLTSSDFDAWFVSSKWGKGLKNI